MADLSRPVAVPAAGLTPVETREMRPDRWETWRAMRLRSLSSDPDAFGSTHAREAAFEEKVWRSRVDGTGGPAVLAYVGTEPVGMGAGWAYEPGRLMVVAMWTDPSWRGQGVGRQVLAHVVAWARQHGLRPDLWVADANPAARRIYEGYGFRPNGETALLREGTSLTMTRLVLPG